MATATEDKKKGDEPEGDEAKKGGRKKLVLLVVGVLLLLAAVWFLFLKPPSEAEKAEKAKPKEGEVVALKPIHINLADGHFLKLGLALQATDKAHEPPDGSKALDLAISHFSNKEMDELESPKAKEEAKKLLLKEMDEAYHHEVMDLYFTEFVMQ